MSIINFISFKDFATALDSKHHLEVSSNCMGNCDDTDVVLVVQAEEIAAQRLPRN